MCSRNHGVGGVWCVVYLTVCSYYQLAVFLKYKLVLTTIALGEISPYIIHLMGKAFIYRTEKYTMLVMSNL